VTTDLRLREQDDDNIILRLDDPYFYELLETVTFKIAKEKPAISSH